MSKRNYVTAQEIDDYSNGAVAVGTVDDQLLDLAEEMIDKYVGFQDRFYKSKLEGMMSAVSSSTVFTLEDIHQNANSADYYKDCEVEIIGGTGAGKRSRVTSCTRAGVVTVDPAFGTTPNTTSIYRIYQLAKFPRQKDVFHDGRHATPTYYKAIPEAVKRAVCAQYEYIIKMGQDFFRTESGSYQSESIGNYSYTRKEGGSGSQIAPKASNILHGIVNRKGVAC